MPFDIAAEIRRQNPPPLVLRGSVSWNVKLLRRALGSAAFGPAHWQDLNRPVSDRFDGDLDEVVRSFQRASGLSDDGVAGPDTWGALAEITGGLPDNCCQLDHGADTASQALRRRIVELAKVAEERHIREVGGQNRGATVELILKHAGGEPGWPWCVAFCWALVDLACFTLNQQPPAMDKLSCSRLVKWAEAHQRLIVSPAEALPGDLLILRGGRTGYRHAGIIVGDADSMNRFPTIEGNTNQPGSATGDGVFSRLRDPAKTACSYVRVS